MSVNGEPGFLTLLDGECNGIVSLACKDGHITQLFSVLNPDKLHPRGLSPVAVSEAQ
jgi:hypothetical protein